MGLSQKSLRRIRAHLKAAKAYADLSYAKRLQVGAVLLQDDRIISVGYNGMPAGMSNRSEQLILDGPIAEWHTRPEVVHAEMNAIAYAAKAGVSTNGCTMVVTHSPCFECSKLLMQSGVKEIYYEKEYRLTESLDFLRANKVTVERIPNESAEEKGTPSTSGEPETGVPTPSGLSGDAQKNSN